MVKNITLAVSNVYALKGIKDFFEALTSLDEMFENFKLNLAADLTGYGLGICMIVGTVALFLKILGFNTEKWALLAGAVFLFILLTF